MVLDFSKIGDGDGDGDEDGELVTSQVPRRYAGTQVRSLLCNLITQFTSYSK